MNKLESSVIKNFNSALSKLTGYKRRIFAAELTKEYFDGSPRQAEKYLKVGREMVKLGLKELETGITCISNYHTRGKKKTEDRHKNLIKDIEAIVDDEGQIDPKFQTEVVYLKITAREVKEVLEKEKGYRKEDFSERTVNNILNRNGYTLKRVQKSKPLKKNS